MDLQTLNARILNGVTINNTGVGGVRVGIFTLTNPEYVDPNRKVANLYLHQRFVAVMERHTTVFALRSKTGTNLV